MLTHEQLKIAAEPLHEDSAPRDPLALFARWYEQAQQAGLFQADAMVLATSTADGLPSCRMVLLASADDHSFVFFSSYESRKGQELAHNPRASLMFWWGPLFRQLRVQGTVARVSDAENETYFAGRPREHQLETWIAPQSQVISSRHELEHRFSEVQSRIGDGPVPRPPGFGGYRLHPQEIEFWQGRLDWLHDSLRYRRREDGSWLLERLAP